MMKRVRIHQDAATAPGTDATRGRPLLNDVSQPINLGGSGQVQIQEIAVAELNHFSYAMVRLEIPDHFAPFVHCGQQPIRRAPIPSHIEKSNAWLHFVRSTSVDPKGRKVGWQGSRCYLQRLSPCKTVSAGVSHR